MKNSAKQAASAGTEIETLIERAARIYDLRGAMGRGDIVAASPAPPETSSVVPPALPRTGRYRASVDRTGLAEQGFILPDAPPTPLAEEFRIVKRQLLTSALGGQGASGVPLGRAILVCSAQPDEGKTFCAVNLALSMAKEKDIEVLLVDADFAKPEILSTLGIDGGAGLMDALADPAIDVENCIIQTDLGNLSVLPAGREINENTELLASESTRNLFENLLLNPSRVVIFDSSPALAASPASVLAALVGQVMMVVRADQTGEAELRDALDLLSACSHIRLLLNAVQLAPHGRRFGAYYGYGT